MSDTILLTGATGQIGTALAPRLLRPPDNRLLALVRARDAEHLAARRKTLVDALGEGRVDVVRGDVTQPGLGLSPADRARVEREVTAVVHGAASLAFDMPNQRATRENVQSTAEVLKLCGRLRERGGFTRLDHISTAYVAGDRTGRVLERECDVGQGFRNSYERSKCEAERMVREQVTRGFPAAVHRPSIVVGDSHTGTTKAWNVLYWPLKVYARGWWRVLPGRPDALVDIVPVDYVADAIAKLREDPRSLGGCFHLAAGDEAPTIDAIVQRVQQLVGAKPIRYVDQRLWRFGLRALVAPTLVTKRGRTVHLKGRAYLPYFLRNPLFDTTDARALLGEQLRPPPFLDYLETIVRYALERDFGRAGREK